MRRWNEPGEHDEADDHHGDIERACPDACQLKAGVIKGLDVHLSLPSEAADADNGPPGLISREIERERRVSDLSLECRSASRMVTVPRVPSTRMRSWSLMTDVP